jgi:hypothetical protein
MFNLDNIQLWHKTITRFLSVILLLAALLLLWFKDDFSHDSRPARSVFVTICISSMHCSADLDQNSVFESIGPGGF